jgi:hypothetical protein
MTEFGDRMRAQRHVLRVVNSVAWHEELFGLSNQAIRRWSDQNGLRPESDLLRHLRVASDRLGFLANRSQMQVSDDYRRAWRDMQSATRDIEDALATRLG